MGRQKRHRIARKYVEWGLRELGERLLPKYSASSTPDIEVVGKSPELLQQLKEHLEQQQYLWSTLRQMIRH